EIAILREAAHRRAGADADVAALAAHAGHAGAEHLARAAAGQRAAGEDAAFRLGIAVEDQRLARLGDAVERPAGLFVERHPAAQPLGAVGVRLARLGAGAG